MPITTLPVYSNATVGAGTIQAATISSGFITTSSGLNGTTYTQNSQLAVNAPRPRMSVKLDGATISLKFDGEENGKAVSMSFKPEETITAKDLSKVVLLSTLLMSGVPIKSTDVVSFIRTNNLEKHFDFRLE